MTDTDLIREMAEALGELVACKDLADQFDAMKQDVRNFATAAVLDGIQAEYQRRKPAAWSGARSALTAARSRLAREDAQPAAVGAHVSVPRELFEAWRGLFFGTDWNRGTAAGYHRRKIEVGMRKLCPIPGEPSSFAAQPAPEPAEPRVPAGWKLVPVDLPDAMRDAGLDGMMSCGATWTSMLHGAYRAMLAAAPAAPPAKPLTEEQIQAERSRRAHAIARGMEPGGRDFDAGVRFAERAHGITAPSAAEG